MLQKIWLFFVGLATAALLSLAFWSNQPLAAQTPLPAASPMPPSRAEVCAVVTTMPGAENTDGLLALLRTDRSQTISDLTAMKTNMGQYDAEGYGWQNIIDGSSALEPRPGSWLIGALRMACESSAAATVSGTVSYTERMALPDEARLVVKLEDVSRADAPSTVIAEQAIATAGQQVPIPFTLTYDPGIIQPQHRYVVRAQIFYGDTLSWTSTTAYPVITQNSPTDVAIMVEQI